VLTELTVQTMATQGGGGVTALRFHREAVGRHDVIGCIRATVGELEIGARSHALKERVAGLTVFEAKLTLTTHAEGE